MKLPVTEGQGQSAKAAKIGCRSAVVHVGRQSTQTRPMDFSRAARCSAPAFRVWFLRSGRS